VVKGHVRKLRAAGTLTDCPDVACRRLKPVVDLDVSPRIQLHAGHLKPDPGSIGSTSGRNQDVTAGDDLLACGSSQVQTDGMSGSSLDPKRVGPKNDLDRLRSENAPDFLGNVGVLAAE